MKSQINHQVVLASRPQGMPVVENFQLIESDLPEITDGEFLMKNLYLSIDAGFRHWMNAGSSDNYLPEMAIGAPVTEKNFFGLGVKPYGSRGPQDPSTLV